MKNLRTVFYNIFVAIGTTLLLSKVISRGFGLKEVLSSNVWYIVGYELSILLTVSLGMYLYHRFSAVKDGESGNDTPTPGKKNKGRLDEKAEQAIRAFRSKFPTQAVILRSTPAEEMPKGHVSCLGRVTWQLPGEGWPLDSDGKRLNPLATIFVPEAPGVPAPFANVALITIFAPEEAWSEAPEEKPQLGCVIRTYPTLEGLEPCQYVSTALKTCILTPEAVANDMPNWPDCGGDKESWDTIFALEKKYKIDYHEDICDANYMTLRKEQMPASFAAETDKRVVYETHKIGGYPTYVQGDPEIIPADYPFVMQINFDSDAELYIADCGSYYLYYNAEKNDWRVYADSY